MIGKGPKLRSVIEDIWAEAEGVQASDGKTSGSALQDNDE
jgi:hypothetical protein